MRNAGRRRLTATSSDWAPRQYTAGVVEDAAFPERSVRPRLWLVRHGETEWARMGRHTGATDIPLTEAGRAQAEAVARRLAGIPFAAVRSSPRSRALDTARLAGFSDRVETDEDLVEWDYGADEGRTTEEIRAERPGWSSWQDLRHRRRTNPTPPARGDLRRMARRGVASAFGGRDAKHR